MTTAIEDKIKELLRMLWEYDNRIDGDEKLAKEYWDEKWSDWLRSTLRSQHTEDMRRVKEAIGEMEKTVSDTGINVYAKIRNDFRQEVLTKIEKI